MRERVSMDRRGQSVRPGVRAAGTRPSDPPRGRPARSAGPGGPDRRRTAAGAARKQPGKQPRKQRRAPAVPGRQRKRASVRPRRGDLTVWILIAAIVLTAVIAVVIVRNGVLVVRNVEVSGSADLPAEEIIRMSRIDFGAPIDSIDEDRLRQNVESSGEYALTGMTVRRPDTVVLEVRRRKGNAVLFTAGEYLVVDAGGYVIRATSTGEARDLVLVTGLDAAGYRPGRRITASEERLEALEAVLTGLETYNGRGIFAQMDLTDPDGITATSRDGTHVILGGPENMDEKIRWAISALNDLANRGESGGTLDVSSGTRADYRP